MNKNPTPEKRKAETRAAIGLGTGILSTGKQPQSIPIGKLKANPSNPRVLRDDKFAKLKKSIQDFPDMLNYRCVVAVTDTDGKLMVLGGNMRLRAMQELGVKEVPVMLADHWSEEQRREFSIKDNIGYGEWDFDQLANEWDAGDLSDWGLDLPEQDVEDGIETKNLEPYVLSHMLISYPSAIAIEVHDLILQLEALGVDIQRSAN